MRTIIIVAVLAACGGGNTTKPTIPPNATLEEKIALDQVPANVMTAFTAKYPDAKPTSAERETPSGKTPNYELAWEADGKKHEATFTADGTFVEEE